MVLLPYRVLPLPRGARVALVTGVCMEIRGFGAAFGASSRTACRAASDFSLASRTILAMRSDSAAAAASRILRCFSSRLARIFLNMGR